MYCITCCTAYLGSLHVEYSTVVNIVSNDNIILHTIFAQRTSGNDKVFSLQNQHLNHSQVTPPGYLILALFEYLSCFVI